MPKQGPQGAATLRSNPADRENCSIAPEESESVINVSRSYVIKKNQKGEAEPFTVVKLPVQHLMPITAGERDLFALMFRSIVEKIIGEAE
jgi:hypothetical protein